MRDGSDAIADWPILNALVNVAAGATWVSVHHGGGVGIGNAIHAGMVVVADGTDAQAERLERVLTTDPGHGRDAARRRRLSRGDRRREERAARAPTASPARVRGLRPRRVGAARAARPRPRAAGDARRSRCAAARTRRSARSRCSRTRSSSATATRSRPSGGCATCRRSTATSRSSTAAGCARSRASSTATRTPRSAATASDEFSLRAGGASYEELHAAGGGILSTVRATRAAGEDGLRAAVERHRVWMLREGTTTFEAKSGYGLDRETELASLRAIRDAGGVPTWLGAHAVPPEFGDADAYLDFALAEVLPAGGRARRGRGRLPRARRVRRGAGAALPRGVPRRRASRCASTATSSPSPARSRSRSSSARARSTTSRRPARRGSERSRRATWPACSSRRARSSSTGRCRPRERSSTPGPRSRSPPTSTRAVLSARACRSSARSRRRSSICPRRRRSPPAPSTRRTCSAAPTGSAGSRRVTAPTSRCSTRPTGATSRTTSAVASSPGWSSAAS